MENVKIYLSGAISGLSFEEQTKWRKQIQDAIKYGDYDLKKTPIFFDPTQYYSIFDTQYKSEREIMEFDLYNLRDANIVVVNFNNPMSLGTCAELAIAYDMKKPIIGINKDNQNLHPWLIEFTSRMCTTLKEAVSYIVNFYLN